MANLLPPDIDDILSSDEWKSLTPGERNSAVDDWAIQAKNATDWTPDEINDLDASIDRFRSSAAESVAEQAGRVVEEGAVGGVKSLASLPFAVPRLGYQAGATLGTAANAEIDQAASGEADSPERDERISAAMQREAPDLSRLLTSGIQTVEGAKAYARERNPFSTNDEMFDAATGKLRDDLLKRKVPEDPDELYEYLKKQGFQIAKATAALHGGEVEDYVPQEFQGGNDEAIFKDYLKQALAGKRPEGFVEFKDDTLPTEGMVTRNQSRSLITSPENLGLLMKFSATRNPAYFEALRQRLGRSLDSQVASGMVSEIEGRRGGNDRFDDAVKTIFSAGGTFPEAGDEMVEQTRSMAQSPIDMASTFFSFGLGKQAAKAAAQRQLLKTAGTVATGVGTEFLEGAASGLQDQALPTDQNLLEEGLMEAVGGGVMQAGGAAVGAAQQGVNYLRDQSIPVAEAAEVETAPLLTPEEQAEVEQDLTLADEVEPVLPATAEALREPVEPVVEEEAAEVNEVPVAPVPVAPQPLPAAVYAPGETIDYNGQPRVVDTFIPSMEDVGGPPASVSFQDDPTTFVPVQSNAQGAIPNPVPGPAVESDASQAEVSLPVEDGIIPSGVEEVAAAPSPVIEAPLEGEVVVQEASPASVGEVIPPQSSSPSTIETGLPRVKTWLTEQLAAPKNEQDRVDLTRFQNEVVPVIERYAPLFSSGINLTGLPEGVGVQIGLESNSLRIDPRKFMEQMRIISDNIAPDQLQKAAEAMLDEEFRHSVSLELERSSPEFARDLQEVWDALPKEVKDLSVSAYEAGTKREVADSYARHEFFRQYWQNAEIRRTTEQALAQNPNIRASFQRLLERFIAALKSIQAGAIPEVKTILDRLIAQAQQRANELRQNAPKTTAQEAVPTPVQDTGIPPVPPLSQEAQAPESTPAQTSLKRAVVDAEREARGAEAIPTPSRRGWTQVELEARAALESNPRAGYELMKKLEFKDSPTTDFENALLLFHKVEIANALENAYREANSAAPENKAEAQAVLDDMLNQYNEVDFHSRAVGTALGRGLNARKMMADLDKKDISLSDLMQQYRNANGEALTAAEQKVVERNAKALQEAQSKVAEVESDEIKAKAAPVEKKLAQETVKEARAERAAKKVTRKSRIANKSKGAREWLKANPEAPVIEGEQGLSAPSLNPRTEALATVGAEYIENGADNLAKFTNELVKEFGDAARNQAVEIYERSQEIVQETQEEIAREEQAFRDKGTPSKVLEKGTERLKGKDLANLDQKLTADLYRSYIRSKPAWTPEQIVDQVRKDLSTLYTNATDSDVRVALTNYGKAKWPTKDALKKREAEDRRQLRLVESIERIKRGQSPLKTGLQRDKPTARERELTKELKDLMREYGIETTSENQLTSSRAAITNRLKNQIEELTRIIEGKSKAAPDRQTVEYTAEMNDLVKERDSLKAYVDELTGPSAEGKWNKKAQQAAKASAEYYRRRIQQQDLESKVSPSFKADEKTKKLQEEAAEAKADFDTLRDLSGITAREQLASAKSSLESQVQRLENEIQTGEKPPAGKPKLKFPELEALKQQVKTLKATIKAIDGTAKTPEQKRAEAATKALEKSIAALERRIREKDLSQRAKRDPVSTPEIDALRAHRDELQDAYAELQEAANPKRIPEEIALDNLKRRIEQKRQEATSAIQLQEYLEVPMQDTRFTERRNAALYEQDQARKAWNEEVLQRRLTARSVPKKILDTGVETLNLMRAILTSVDLSAVLRQAGFIALGNPARAARTFGPMLRAFASDQARFEAMEKLKARPNYPICKNAGLFLSDVSDTDMSKVEEAFVSRWVDKIPKALGGGVIRGSQRAYTTMLNQIRADTFDAMYNSLGGKQRVTKEEGKALANFVNVATGRGVIGPSGKQSGNPFLSTVFFSPRLVASRFNLLAGQPLYGGNARTRTLIAREYAKYMVGVTAALALVALMRDPDDDEKFLETDPRSADFLKARFGNTRLDLFSGLLQATVLMSRLTSGQTKKGDGEVVDIRGEDKPFSGSSAGDLMWRFIRSKLSPAIGSVVNLYEGEDYSGKPTSIKQEAAKMVVPMSVGSVADAMVEQGVPRGTALSVLSILGAGLQTYDPDKEKK